MPEIYCSGIDTNISTWGQCIVETAFFGDPLIFGISLYALFGLMMYNFNLPGVLALPVGLLLSVAMYLMSPSPVYFVILALAVVANFAFVAMVLMNRWNIR